MATSSIYRSRKWRDGGPADDERPWVDIKGRIRVGSRIVYHEGIPMVDVHVKYVRPSLLLGAVPDWRSTYYEVKVPTDKKDRSEMLRNMATMHAMKLGFPHKLRSKKL